LSWLLLLLACGEVEPIQHPSIVNPVTDEWVQGLVKAPGRAEVLANCTACHSTKLITQNRMSRERWDQTITWMQQTQKLWPLEPSVRTAILDYLEQTQGDEAVLLRGDHGSPWHRPRYPANPIEWPEPGQERD